MARRRARLLFHPRILGGSEALRARPIPNQHQGTRAHAIFHNGALSSRWGAQIVVWRIDLAVTPSAIQKASVAMTSNWPSEKPKL